MHVIKSVKSDYLLFSCKSQHVRDNLLAVNIVYEWINKMKFLSNCLSIVILDQPEFVRKSIQQVNESEKITLARDIVNNPLSDSSWY